MTPEEWESLCILNIRKAEKEKNNSLSLRALVDSLLEQTASDMRRQYEATGRAFELRIEETKTAKTQLENQLNEVSRTCSTASIQIKASSQFYQLIKAQHIFNNENHVFILRFVNKLFFLAILYYILY